MSLKSNYDLSCDGEFRGKVTVALAQVCRKIVDENTQTDEGQARKFLALEILHNVPHYAERAFPLVAADSTIDSSASDEQIIIAVRKAIYALVR